MSQGKGQKNTTGAKGAYRNEKTDSDHYGLLRDAVPELSPRLGATDRQHRKKEASDMKKWSEVLSDYYRTFAL